MVKETNRQGSGSILVCINEVDEIQESGRVVLSTIERDLRDRGINIEITEYERPTVELVRRSSTPYYPEWKVTIGGKTRPD